MREILFRGKRVGAGEWAEGDLHKNIEFTKAHIHPTGEKVRSVDVIPETVGQYTGLKDKNGVKIFEGDIVDASDEWWYACGPAGHDSPILQVEYDADVCGFAPFAIYDCDCGVYIDARRCDVIGNIHDNPKLLEV